MQRARAPAPDRGGHADRADTAGYWYVAIVEIVLVAVVASGAVAWAIAANQRRKQKRGAVLAQIAGYLGGQDTGSAAFGARHGGAVTFQFATRGGGSNRESWTEIDVVVPSAYPLAIHVRRHRWLDKAGIGRGNMIDLQLDDPPFDAAFVVEAAPEDVVRVLLDARVRCFLLSHPHVELETMTVGECKVLRLAIREWIEDVPAATAAIELVAGIGARVRDAYATVEAAPPYRPGGSPYRPEVDARHSRDMAAARSAEVAVLEAMRARRARYHKALVISLAILIALIWLAMIQRV
jgi:hypothetical protein